MSETKNRPSVAFPFWVPKTEDMTMTNPNETKTAHTPGPIEGLLLHIRKQFGEKDDTDALILRWADLAALEALVAEHDAAKYGSLEYRQKIWADARTALAAAGRG